MVKRKTKKKTTKKKGRKKKSRSSKMPRLLIIAFLAGVFFSAALFFMFFRNAPDPQSKDSQQTSFTKEQPSILYEEPELPPRTAKIKPQKKNSIPKKIGPLATRHDKKTKPEVAIVIDDMGHSISTGNRLISLDLNLSFSFLPSGAHTEQQIELAGKRGRDILLHLPMEPADRKWDPGPDALYLNMSRDELRTSLRKNLSSVPMAVGINNHMGSRFTQNSEGMRIVLNEIKGKNLFYLDSVTSSYSVGFSLAQELGIKTAKRDIFLDNVQDKKMIKKQLDSLIKFARKNGSGIAIGHPHSATLAALEDYSGKLSSEVTVVALHALVR